MFNYYVKIESEEHMLYASEIASCYNIYNEKGNKVHKNFMSAFLHHYIKEKYKDYMNKYYLTANGLVEVYPFFIYSSAIRKLNLILKEPNKVYTLKINDRNYKVQKKQ